MARVEGGRPHEHKEAVLPSDWLSAGAENRMGLQITGIASRQHPELVITDTQQQLFLHGEQCRGPSCLYGVRRDLHTVRGHVRLRPALRRSILTCQRQDGTEFGGGGG
ncbi:unnamed protein product [Boreogadus saida]